MKVNSKAGAEMNRIMVNYRVKNGSEDRRTKRASKSIQKGQRKEKEDKRMMNNIKKKCK